MAVPRFVHNAITEVGGRIEDRIDALRARLRRAKRTAQRERMKRAVAETAQKARLLIRDDPYTAAALLVGVTGIVAFFRPRPVDGTVLQRAHTRIRAAGSVRNGQAVQRVASAQGLVATKSNSVHSASGGSVVPASGTADSRWWQVSPVALLKRVWADFVEDDVLTLSAALAFYTLLSFAPLLVLGVWIASFLGGGAQEAMLGQIAAIAGNDARLAAQAVIASAEQRPTLGSFAGIAGIVTALIGATTVFAQLQASLNRIWSIEARPAPALWAWLRRRVLSLGLIGAAVFVLMASLAVSAALGFVLTNTGATWQFVNALITTAVFAVLFMLLFRYLPDARVPWKHAGWGGLLTAILFGIGKFAIGLYLAHGDVGGAYGAAGSLVVMLVWVYYSGAVFFFGAELVQAWLAEQGRSIIPAETGRFDANAR